MKRVAVVRGGPSEEYSVSMETGKAVLGALDELGYPCKDIVITKKGEWLEQGLLKRPEQLLEAVDIVFIALHGTYGEDGQIQRLLEHRKLPYVGTRALASSIAFNKALTKESLMPHGLKMPRHRVMRKADLIHLDEDIPHIFREIGNELFIKPLASGSSVGAQHIPDADTLRTSLTQLLQLYDQIIIEEYIRGREATVGVLENFRNHRTYALPVVEVVPPRDAIFYDAQNKYDGTTEHVCPGRFSLGEKIKLHEAAMFVHDTIGCKHYSRSDFIVKDGDIYFLEINTLPGLTQHSNLPIAAQAVGLEFPYLIQHLIDNAHH